MKKFLWMAAVWVALIMNTQAQHVCTDPNCTSCAAPATVWTPDLKNQLLDREKGRGKEPQKDHVNEGQTRESSPYEEQTLLPARLEHDGEETPGDHDDHASCGGGEGHACGAEEPAHDDHSSCGGHDDHAEEGGLNISNEMAEKIGLKVSVAKNGSIEKSVVFPAEILLNRDRSSAVSPRYASVIRQVFVDIGDQVKKGDVLASLENRETLSVYTVLSPLDGTVVSKDASLGEFAAEDRILFEVADLSTVWANINIFPKYQHLIKNGMSVTFTAHDGHTAQGVVKYVSPIASHETRTFTARCVLSGADEDFTPGVFVRAQIITESAEVLVRVERSAVQTVQGSTMVFILDEHGFESRDVVVGMANEKFVEIKQGLAAGESYVSAGSFALKAQMVTKGMDPHAGHGH